MPTIPKEILDCVVYLYADEAAADAKKTPGGTGFLIGLKSTSFEHDNIHHIYVVTNHHVAVGGENSCIRVNTLDGKTELFSVDPSEWTCDVGLDLAVLPLKWELEKYKSKCIPSDMFMTDTTLAEWDMNAGEDVFMIGVFLDNHGDTINTPAVRFGNISLMPSEMEFSKYGHDYSGKYYCLDMRSRTGFSGSPIFVYRTSTNDLRPSNVVSLGPPQPKFLGVHAAQYPETIVVEDAKGVERDLTAPSGMTMVIPAQRILDLLNTKKLAEQRSLSKWRTSLAPRTNQGKLEDANAEVSGDDILKAALNMPPQQHKAAK